MSQAKAKRQNNVKKERNDSETKLTVFALKVWTAASLFTGCFCRIRRTALFYVKLSYCLPPLSLEWFPRRFVVACGGEERYFTSQSVEGGKTLSCVFPCLSCFDGNEGTFDVS